ncbi:Rrp15p-domain-containing protein [Phlyctochytrium arcticum]|nr:Rrp15p-domain-containing protein [Phlyctochytrium arcticum]
MPPKRKTPSGAASSAGKSSGRKAPFRDKNDDRKKKRKIKPSQDQYISPDEDAQAAPLSKKDKLAAAKRPRRSEPTLTKANGEKVETLTAQDEIKDLKTLEEVAESSDDEEDAVVIESGLDSLENGSEGESDDEGGEGEDDEFGMAELAEDGEEQAADDQDTKGDSKSKSAKMASAIGKVLSGDLGTKDEHRPILAKQKHLERALDEEKLEAKARKIVSAERKRKINIGRLKPTHSTTDYEKQLRKVATRGVVQLFNAIRVAQKTAEEIKAETVQKNATTAKVVSKNTFMEMINKNSALVDTKSNGEGAAKLTSGSSKGATPSAAAPEPAAAVAWTQPDFMMKAPKHWDEEDDDDEEDNDMA